MRLPIRPDPVALISGSRVSARMRSPTVEPRPTDYTRNSVWNIIGLEHFANNVLARDGAKRRLAGRLPHDWIATDKGQCAVPRPYRNRKIKGSNDADGSERVPLLHHAVHGPLALERGTGKRAAKTGGIIADIDHFLHFAEAFGEDFAHLQRDEPPQRILFLAQSDSKLTHDFASFGRRHGAPELECFHRLFDNFVVVGLARLFDFGQQFPGGRAVDFDPIAARRKPLVPVARALKGRLQP